MSNKPLTEDQLIKALQGSNLEIDKKLEANNLVLEKLIDNKIKANTDELFNRFKEYFASKHEIEEIVEKVVDRKLKQKVGNLPTKEHFDQRMDELMGEIKAEREENTILEDRSSENKKRITRIESHLDLSPNA